MPKQHLTTLASAIPDIIGATKSKWVTSSDHAPSKGGLLSVG